MWWKVLLSAWLVSVALSGASAQLGADPIGLWPLDAQFGATDATGNGNDGVPVGTQLAPGPYGTAEGAFEFSGTATSYMDIPNNGAMDARYSYTILAHIFPTGDAGPIFNYVGTNYENAWAVHLWQTTAQQLFMRTVGRDGTFPSGVSALVLQQNAWNYVGGTYDSSTGVETLWHNGVVVGQQYIGLPEVATQYPVRVAVRDNDARYYRGCIACIQLYDYAMTQEQIEAARDRCLKSAAVGLWPLNSRYGPTDVTGNGNDGVPVGTGFALGPYGTVDGAFEFSGTATSYIDIPNNGALDVRYSYTILAHIFPTGDTGPIFNYVGDGNAYAVHFWQTTAQRLFMRTVGRYGAWPDPVTADVLQQNAWNYVGGTYDSSTGIARLWHDGINVASLVINVAEVATQFAVRVAVRDDDDRYYAGRIACIQVYDFAMTQEQIRAAKDIIWCKPAAIKQVDTDSISTTPTTIPTTIPTTTPTTTPETTIPGGGDDDGGDDGDGDDDVGGDDDDGGDDDGGDDWEITLIILIDGSASVGRDAFELAMDYIEHVLECFNHTKVGLIYCKCEPYIHIRLGSYDNIPDLTTAVEEVQFYPSTTRVGHCIHYTQCTTYWEDDVPSVILVFSDGQIFGSYGWGYYDDVPFYVQKAMNAGITIYAASIGRSIFIDWPGLWTITGGDGSRVVDTAEDDPSWLITIITIENCGVCIQLIKVIEIKRPYPWEEDPGPNEGECSFEPRILQQACKVFTTPGCLQDLMMNFAGFWDSIGDIWADVEERTGSFIDDVQNGVEALIGGAQDAINAAGEAVRDGVQNIVDNVRSTVSSCRISALDILSQLAPFVNTVRQNIQDIICNIISDAKERLIDAISEFFEGLVKDVFDVFCDFLDGLINTLQALLDALSFILPQSLEDFLNNLLAKARLLLWLKRIARLFGESLGRLLCRLLWWLIRPFVPPFIYPRPFLPPLPFIPPIIG